MATLQADLGILWPALIAGILLVLPHVPLGQLVLSRDIVFIDLAIAQVAEASAALAGALLLTWTERKRPESQEALIGVRFALVVTLSVQMVGVYLVFTSLIAPAVATCRYPARRQLAIGYGLAIASYVVGLVLSALLDLPSSPVIVWTMAVLGLLAHLAGARPRRSRATAVSRRGRPAP